MKIMLIVCASLTIATLGAGEAAAAPSWCAGGRFGDRNTEPDMSKLSSPDPDEVVIAIARALCAPNDEARAQVAAIEGARKAWSTKLGMIDADWADAAAYASTERRQYDITIATKNYAESSPLDQYAQIQEGDGAQVYGDVLYIADLFESRMTEVGRLGLIRWCMQTGSGHELDGHANAVKWATCQHDIDVFDKKKFDDQVRSDTTHPGEQKMLMRLIALQEMKLFKTHAAAVQKIWKDDGAFKKTFEIAAQAQAEWLALAPANAKALELTLALDGATHAQSRKAFTGCDEATTTVLGAALGSVPAATFAGMHDVREDPPKGFGTLASKALRKFPAVKLAAVPFMLCHPKSAKNAFLANILGDGPGMRGPRTLAEQRIRDAALVLDDMNEHLMFPSFSQRPYSYIDYAVDSAGGPVKSTKPIEGDRIEVQLESTFVTTHDCVKEHYSNRVERIRDNGEVVYALICDREADVKHDNQWAPFQIVKADAPWAKPGAVISVSFADGTGEVIATWSSKTAKTPATVLGTSLTR